nr:hypothetical protein [Tanacetum cinerariifolium]
MHNEIMAAGSTERPSMLAPGSYAQWKSRFMIYVDTKPNKDQLRQCIEEVQWVLVLMLGKYGLQFNVCSNESINLQDVKTTLFWEFGKFTSIDGELIESYYKRFYRMMNEMVKNKLKVDTMHVNVQFSQKLQPKWLRFVTIVKQSQDLDIVSYHKLFDILKQHQNKVNEIRAERIVMNANLLTLIAAKRIVMNANPLTLIAATQHYLNTYPQAPYAPEPYKTQAPSSR